MEVLVLQRVLQVNLDKSPIRFMYVETLFKHSFVHVHPVTMVVVVNYVIIVNQIHGKIKLNRKDNLDFLFFFFLF